MASKVVMTQKGHQLRKDLYEEFESPFHKIQNSKDKHKKHVSPSPAERRDFSKSINSPLQFEKHRSSPIHGRVASMVPETKLARLDNMHRATEAKRQQIVNEIRFKAHDRRKISFNFVDVKNMKRDNDKMRKMLNKGTAREKRR